MFEMEGPSFTGLTVNPKLVLEVIVPSLTVKVMVVLPDWFAAGTTFTVRFPPLPPNVMFPAGTKVGLDEAAVTIRLAAGVSASDTVKLIGPVAVSSFTTWSAIGEILGATPAQLG